MDSFSEITMLELGMSVPDCPEPCDDHAAMPVHSPRAESLFRDLYHELRSIAAAHLRGEWRCNHTLQSVDLVNEAFLRFNQAGSRAWTSDAEFKAYASRVMRQVLCDHARRRKRLKRGGQRARLTIIDSALGAGPGPEIDPLMLDELLTNLSAQDERAAHVVEMRFFGGMTMDEVAAALGVSKRTVENDWTYARTWLFGQLRDRTNT